MEIRNPNAIRPWQHVLDALGGYLILAANMRQNPVVFSGAWNFGPSIKENLSVKELISKLISLTGQGEFVIPSLTQTLHESNQLQLDISKAEKFLGYKNVLSIDEALMMTSRWYSEYKTANIADICLEQINIWNSKYIQQNEQGA